MRTREERREEERRYEADVYYEAWRSGMDPERAVSCALDCYDAGRTAEECVSHTRSRIYREQERIWEGGED